MNESEQKVEGIFDTFKIFSWGRKLIADVKAGDLDGIVASLEAIAGLLGFSEWAVYAKRLASAIRELIAAIKTQDVAAILLASAAVSEQLAEIIRHVASTMAKVQEEQAVRVMASAPKTLDELDKKLEELKAKNVKLDPFTILTLLGAFLSIFKNLPDFIAYIRKWWADHSPQPAIVVG